MSVSERPATRSSRGATDHLDGLLQPAPPERASALADLGVSRRDLHSPVSLLLAAQARASPLRTRRQHRQVVATIAASASPKGCGCSCKYARPSRWSASLTYRFAAR
jgi:hypothetical protein